MDWFGYVILILRGALVTIELTVIGCCLALIVAFAVGLSKISRIKIIRFFAIIYVEFFRGTSIVVQLFWAFYALPLFGINLNPFTAGVLVLGLNVGAYAAEIVRGALQSIPKEQIEACVALNFNSWQRLRWVVFPQAFVMMLPGFGNNAIELLKVSAVVSLITISDLTFQAQIVRSATGNTLIPLLSILIIYLVIASILARMIRFIEFKMRRGWYSKI